MEVSDTCSSSPQVLDPLLKDFSERKQSFRRSVVSLASELKEARTRLASNEELVARESLIRQAAETRAKCMEEEMCHMKNCLEESNAQLLASASIAEKYLKELNNLRSQHSTTRAVADADAALAHSAELQCLSLLKQLLERENRAVRLEVQLGLLQKDIDMREASQNQLKNGVLRIQKEILQASVKSSVSKDSELKKISDKISPKTLEEINKHFSAKDEEIAKLQEEITTTSANWNLKTSELESQLENQRKINQELKKRVLKLDFCLQEARFQMRKLQRIGEKKEQALKELEKQLDSKQQQGGTGGTNKQNFWESSGFKILVSMSMLILVVFAKR